MKYTHHIALWLLSLTLGAMTLTGCDIVVPPDRPLEEKLLLPTDYVFKTIDYLAYEFIGVTRVDCPKVASAFSGTGRCLPAKSPKGATYVCPLAAPFDKLEMGCLTTDEVPAVYLRITWNADAKNIAFPQSFGACQPSFVGPAAGQPERYPTDPGHKVCLFEGSETMIGGRLSANDDTARPIGMYLDLAQTDLTPDTVKAPFHGPVELVMDARYFEPEDREKAYQTMFKMLDVYRDPSTKADLTQPPAQATNNEEKP